ncbi:MBL fold metallo-hydrolase [Chloroflexota bacterium]
MIIKAIVVGMYGTNCYVVGSEATKLGMIVDPGAEPKNILDTIHGLGLSIEWIVVTHSHIDHIGALSAVKGATGAKVAMHEDAGSGLGQALAHTLGGVLSGSINKPVKPDKLLKDGDVLNIGDLNFTVLYTPGHSHGGISLVGHGVVFSGDTLFNLGIGRTDLPGGNYRQLLESIRSKLMTLPDETIVFSGHGPETTIGDERRMNPFLD